jgi:hypothetical protein
MSSRVITAAHHPFFHPSPPLDPSLSVVVDGMRILLPLVAACLYMALAAPAHAAWPALAGTTTIEGSQTGYATVRLDRPLELDLFDGIPAQVSGGGRFHGAILRRDGGRGEGAFHALLLRGDGMEAYEGDALSIWATDEEYESERDTKTMPAGLYRLYLIADGRPTSVRLTLPLPGSTTVTPEVPVRQTLRDLERVDDTPGSNAAAFGGDAVSARRACGRCG